MSPAQAITWFDFGADLVTPIITSVEQSEYIGEPAKE
jgi:hypothetical protein